MFSRQDGRAQDEISPKGGTGRSLLDHAACARSLDDFRFLIESRADVGGRRGLSGHGEQALRSAAANSQQDVVEYVAQDCGELAAALGEQARSGPAAGGWGALQPSPPPARVRSRGSRPRRGVRWEDEVADPATATAAMAAGPLVSQGQSLSGVAAIGGRSQYLPADALELELRLREADGALSSPAASAGGPVATGAAAVAAAAPLDGDAASISRAAAVGGGVGAYGAYHDPSSASQNVGNSIGTRSCVRQSKLFRMYESGNATKALLGQQSLQWDVNHKEGAYSGRVFDGVGSSALGCGRFSPDGREMRAAASLPAPSLLAARREALPCS
mmetsp:Transcript_35388/g.100576  ORF Transcript_35388/g.100576 Transcript_35388/m.100576 type:complete len:331 (+) Transcript_35388:84-1076(+)